MIVIGERLNSSVKYTRDAMEREDGAAIAAIAREQKEAGADYLDINAALFMEKEVQKLLFTVKCVLAEGNTGIMLDSANYTALGEVLKTLRLKDVILNSITLQKDRFKGFLPLVLEYGTGVVALPIDEGGVPAEAGARAAAAGRLIEALVKEGVPMHKIFADILVETAATGKGPKTALETIGLIRADYPDVHVICGLSNVSFGLPKRESLNTAFLAAAVCSGLDSAILDITSAAVRRMLHAARVIAGEDEYCLDYIEFCKNER